MIRILPRITAYRLPSFTRFYAKNAKANAKKKVEKSGATVTMREFDLEKHEKRMAHLVDKFKQDLSAIRMGVANPHCALELLDGVKVDTPEGRFKISQVAQIIVKDRQNLQVIVPDTHTCALIDKAIKAANLNLNPQHVDAHILRVPIPKMSQEYRQTLTKEIHQLCEQQKERIRHERQNARNDLKKHQAPSVDDNRRLEKQIQDLTDKACKAVEDLEKAKINEIQKQ